MVDMKEIISGLWKAFAPFAGKAIIAIIIVGILGFAIDIIAHKIKSKKDAVHEEEPDKQN